MLFEQGLGKRMVFSGGRNPAAPLSEPQAMEKIALDRGIPEDAIILDERGSNTFATVASAKALARRHGWRRLLMVSHDYHLSRISALSHRAGLVAYTVPAHETRALTMKPYYIQREIAAWIYYYLKGVQEGLPGVLILDKLGMAVTIL
ncbi:MAG: YdcF family protein [Planctomycetes bacterium]|nr:YdcF family protein [Planctomycetota bacterium]